VTPEKFYNSVACSSAIGVRGGRPSSCCRRLVPISSAGNPSSCC